ncbi:type IV toxin-antitoxin system AbiEi family antitoxin domain-containing protein [Pseudomaricurvus alcaniphilus]|uniref:type IV toxin-antitoxin system AbiEi family antitoxin domain-containing protein n=1 Tax=Pseudomaricurvus alcaniphilus TaxID=1166482 RepID=UPI001409565E|nr:type IV toxin-antitoxin system AbiEi family antitoxin domain-containing protein [Pseudomaricurvus alcaniphilus]NHN35915.1 type IV toxin-antitoxin system AbiEi family antitoxin domain-containing protein [Pseudomaricurvus alcaniphilus]
MKNSPLKQKLALRLKRSRKEVFLRSDFADLGGYDQVGRALKQLVDAGQLVRIGKGLYTRARPSAVTGKPTIAVPGGFKAASRAALNRLGYQWKPDVAEQRYNQGETTQVSASAGVIVQGRLNRKIGFGNQSLKYQTKP